MARKLIQRMKKPQGRGDAEDHSGTRAAAYTEKKAEAAAIILRPGASSVSNLLAGFRTQESVRSEAPRPSAISACVREVFEKRIADHRRRLCKQQRRFPLSVSRVQRWLRPMSRDARPSRCIVAKREQTPGEKHATVSIHRTLAWPGLPVFFFLDIKFVGTCGRSTDSLIDLGGYVNSLTSSHLSGHVNMFLLRI